MFLAWLDPFAFPYILPSAALTFHLLCPRGLLEARVNEAQVVLASERAARPAAEGRAKGSVLLNAQHTEELEVCEVRPVLVFVVVERYLRFQRMHSPVLQAV